MKNLKYMPALVLAAALQLVSVGAFAQPDPNNAPKLENPENRAPRLRNRMQGQGGVQIDPAMRQQMMAQREKMQLQRAGITDATQQDAILAYMTVEREADTKLREKGQELQRSMRGNAMTDIQLVALLNAYHVAIEENKERHTKAINTLKATIDFTKNPRVEAYLTLAGYYGDGPAVMGGGGGGRMAGMRGAQMGGEQGADGAQAMRRNNRLNRNGAQGAAANANAAGATAGVMQDGAAATGRKRNKRNNTPEAPAPAPVAEA